jgi:hypothetical protein
MYKYLTLILTFYGVEFFFFFVFEKIYWPENRGADYLMEYSRERLCSPLKTF